MKIWAGVRGLELFFSPKFPLSYHLRVQFSNWLSLYRTPSRTYTPWLAWLSFHHLLIWSLIPLTLPYHNHTYHATRLGTLSVATGFPMAIIMYTDALVLKFKAINRHKPTDLHCIQSDNQQSRQMKASSPVCSLWLCDEVGTKKKKKCITAYRINAADDRCLFTWFRTTIQRL